MVPIQPTKRFAFYSISSDSSKDFNAYRSPRNKYNSKNSPSKWVNLH